MIKKSTKKTKSVRSKKPVDLTADKTSTVVKTYVNTVQKKVKEGLKDAHIPAFSIIATNPDLLQSYFLEYDFYVSCLGKNIDMFNRIVRVAIATHLADQIDKQLHKPDSAVVYPGVWDAFNVTSLVLRMISLVTIDDHMAIGIQLPEENNADMDEETKQAMFMKFNEYNPNRFYQYMVVTYKTVFDLINAEITAVVPSALACGNFPSLHKRYGVQFGEMIEPAIHNWNALEDIESKDINEQATTFIELIEKGLFGYVTVLLSESGFTSNVIESVFTKSKVNVQVNNETKGGKQASTLIHPWVKLKYTLRSTVSKHSVEMVISPRDIWLIGATDHELSEDTVAQAELRVGKELKRFIDGLATYAFNLAISEKSKGASKAVVS